MWFINYKSQMLFRCRGHTKRRSFVIVWSARTTRVYHNDKEDRLKNMLGQ